jgi:hypothetical protein
MRATTVHEFMSSISHHQIAAALGTLGIAVLLATHFTHVSYFTAPARSQVQAQSQTHAAVPGSAKVVADYTVFFDPPTGFVFVKLPAGWKFSGKVEGADVAKLPASVVTYLLNPDSEEDRATR